MQGIWRLCMGAGLWANTCAATLTSPQVGAGVEALERRPGCGHRAPCPAPPLHTAASSASSASPPVHLTGSAATYDAIVWQGQPKTGNPPFKKHVGEELG